MKSEPRNERGAILAGEMQELSMKFQLAADGLRDLAVTQGDGVVTCAYLINSWMMTIATTMPTNTSTTLT